MLRPAECRECRWSRSSFWDRSVKRKVLLSFPRMGGMYWRYNECWAERNRFVVVDSRSLSRLAC